MLFVQVTQTIGVKNVEIAWILRFIMADHVWERRRHSSFLSDDVRPYSIPTQLTLEHFRLVPPDNARMDSGPCVMKEKLNYLWSKFGPSFVRSSISERWTSVCVSQLSKILQQSRFICKSIILWQQIIRISDQRFFRLIREDLYAWTFRNVGWAIC